VPDAPGLELILAEINRSHPGAVLDTGFDRDQAALIVDHEQILAVLTWLKETPGQQYTFLASVHGADYLPAQPRFAVHYELVNRERYERLRVKALLEDPAVAGEGASGTGSPGAMEPSESAPDAPSTGAGESENASPAGIPASERLPHLDSCVELFPTAEFQEREVYDFFGIVFDGHPDMRRILMPEDYVGWPQRRDFPVGGEPVIFTRDEAANPGWWE
jgi:NADH-quinone oxidoreductase subunit C